MTKSFIFSTALSTAFAGGLLLAGAVTPAEAVPSAPATGQAAAAQGALIHEAGWRCGPRRCWWVRNYRGPLPPYARGWGPPHRPDCYWKRGLLGNWKYKCD